MKLFLTMSLIETHKTRWDWKTILNLPLNVPPNETHKTTWRGLMGNHRCCLPKIDPRTKQHIGGGGHYGDCIKDSCSRVLSEDEFDVWMDENTISEFIPLYQWFHQYQKIILNISIWIVLQYRYQYRLRKKYWCQYQYSTQILQYFPVSISVCFSNLRNIDLWIPLL